MGRIDSVRDIETPAGDTAEVSVAVHPLLQQLDRSIAEHIAERPDLEAAILTVGEDLRLQIAEALQMPQLPWKDEQRFLKAMNGKMLPKAEKAARDMRKPARYQDTPQGTIPEYMKW